MDTITIITHIIRTPIPTIPTTVEMDVVDIIMIDTAVARKYFV